MSPRPRRGLPRPGSGPLPLAVAILVLGAAASAPTVSGGPPIPVGTDGSFLEALAAPVLAPGAAGTVGFELHDPLGGALSSIALDFELYAFDAAPGGATGPLPAAGVSILDGNGTSTSATFRYAQLEPGAPPISGSFGVLSDGSAPRGAYSIRTSLTFVENGSSYRFESRGFFTESAWTSATLPGGNGSAPRLNLSRLGVDGVTPETAVGVTSNGFALPVWGLVGGGVVLATVGAYLYARRGPGSRSGARSAGPPPQSAPSAVGK